VNDVLREHVIERDYLLEKIRNLEADVERLRAENGKLRNERREFPIPIEVYLFGGRSYYVREDVIRAWARQDEYILQALGKALGYPWYKDDQENFPGATEADGVCTGEHVAESIADEAAMVIERLRLGSDVTPETIGAETSPEIEINYTNHQGKCRLRRIAPQRLWYGSTKWHQEPQWLLRAVDTEKGDVRDFALGCIHRWGTIRPETGKETPDDPGTED
jgi:hypothetical protein